MEAAVKVEITKADLRAIERDIERKQSDLDEMQKVYLLHKGIYHKPRPR